LIRNYPMMITIES